MAYFPDLGQQAGAVSGECVRAVGWLDGVHPFSQGKVSWSFAWKLRRFVRSWMTSTAVLGLQLWRGLHVCELCGRNKAGGNFGVPGDGILFIAPEMIAHYVRAHRYMPPVEFIDALLKAPLPGTNEYRVAVEPCRHALAAIGALLPV